MARFDVKFDAAKFTRDLERDMKKNIERMIRHHPEKVLDEYQGELVDSKCKHCGHNAVMVISKGFYRCPQCGESGKINLDVKWK